MKLQPVNQNNTLDNHHAYAVGMSGCGKTSAAKKLFVKATDQVVIFDPLNDYQGKLMGRVVRSYSNLRDFAIAVIAGRKTKGLKLRIIPNEKPPKKILTVFAQLHGVSVMVNMPNQ